METNNFIQLNTLQKGQKARIMQISETNLNGESLLPEGELERRLLEMGFAEGLPVKIMHEGPFGKDPIVVSLGESHLVALRRNEASAILVQNLV